MDAFNANRYPLEKDFYFLLFSTGFFARKDHLGGCRKNLKRNVGYFLIKKRIIFESQYEKNVPQFFRQSPWIF